MKLRVISIGITIALIGITIALIVAVSPQNTSLISANPEGSIPVSLVYQGSHCGTLQAKTKIISDTHAWTQATRNRNLLGATSPAPPRFNQDTTFYFITAGQKPSAGYHFRLTTRVAQWHDKTLEIPIELLEPEGVVATVITSPCAIVSVESKITGPVKTLF